MNTTTSLHRLMSGIVAISALLIPASASAYLLPEEVLWNDYYVPPRARDVEEAASRQARESADRREAEQEAIFAEQHPPEPVIVEEETTDAHTAAPSDNTSLEGIDLEVLRTIRLLERIDARQDVLEDLSSLPAFHTGAPLEPLTHTGPESIFAAVMMLGAVGWTLKRAGKQKGWVRRALR
ncbi:MAG: hypothetical protein WCX61_00755 [Candidatus Peribacteraceae bacterium]